MSKLTKLIKSPKLFFIDALKKKNKQGNKNSLKNDVNVNFSHINFCQSIPIILHSGESTKGGSSHLRLWLPTFMQSEVKFLVLVRNIELYKWLIKEYPGVSVVLARRLLDIEALMALLPDAMYVFYPSSTGNNIHITRFSHLNHVFIGHGDSDKAASAHKALRLYDEIWVAGQAHIDRFKNSDFNTAHLSFLKVGRPNLTCILENSQSLWSERMTCSILYLPTWEGVMEESNYSSTHISGKIIREIISNIKVPISVKYHPLTGNRNPLLKNISSATQSLVTENLVDLLSVIDTSVSIADLIPSNNIFICDISAVVSECLTANAPIFVYIPSDRSIKISSSNMSYEDYCYTFSNVEELITKIESVLSGKDYMADNRKKAIEYFISSEETLNNKFIEQLRSIGSQKQLKYISRQLDQF